MGQEETGPRRPEADHGGEAWTRAERAHDEIRAFFDREFSAAGEPGQTSALLDEIRNLLVPHFADEEGPEGLYAALRAISPAVESDLKFLRQEHRQILGALEYLERQVHEADELEPSEARERLVERIKETMARLVQMIRRHERVENGLVAEIYNLDEGGSG
jgi:hypothetical protein